MSVENGFEKLGSTPDGTWVYYSIPHDYCMEFGFTESDIPCALLSEDWDINKPVSKCYHGRGMAPEDIFKKYKKDFPNAGVLPVGHFRSNLFINAEVDRKYFVAVQDKEAICNGF